MPLAPSPLSSNPRPRVSRLLRAGGESTFALAANFWDGISLTVLYVPNSLDSGAQIDKDRATPQKLYTDAI